jgi:hypothetical protein
LVIARHVVSSLQARILAQAFNLGITAFSLGSGQSVKSFFMHGVGWGLKVSFWSSKIGRIVATWFFGRELGWGYGVYV